MNKFIIIFTLLFTSVLAYESNNNNNNNNNSPSDEGSNEWESSPRNGNFINGRSNSDVNGLTAENLGAIFQRQGQQNRHGQRQRVSNNNEADDSSLGYWASYPDSAAFDAKIKGRLSASKALVDKPEVRRKITQLAEDKFNQCKVLTDDRERACLGRVTGQIMQLVSAVENMARNPQ